MKKIITQIRNEINFSFVAAAFLVEGLFLSFLAAGGLAFYNGWPKIRDHFAQYKLCGQVLEYGSEAAVPAFKISFNEKHLYSLYDGSYCWSNLPLGAQLSFEIPAEYESSVTALTDYSQYKELSPFERQTNHNLYLVLGVESAATRIFDFQKQGAFSNLWVYLTPSSQQMWSNKPADFSKALTLENSLRAKLDQSQLVDYHITARPSIGDNLYQYKVRWVRADGSSFVREETFEKIDNWWHYVFPRLPKEVYDYIYITQKTLK